MSCGHQRQRLRCLLCLPACQCRLSVSLSDCLSTGYCYLTKTTIAAQQKVNWAGTHTHSNHTHTHSHSRRCELPTGLLTTCFAYKATLVMTSTPYHFPRSGCGWRLIVSLGGTQCALCYACVCVSVLCVVLPEPRVAHVSRGLRFGPATAGNKLKSFQKLMIHTSICV